MSTRTLPITEDRMKSFSKFRDSRPPTIIVTPSGSKEWRVRLKGASRAARVFDSKEAAIQYATKYAKRVNGKTRVVEPHSFLSAK